MCICVCIHASRYVCMDARVQMRVYVWIHVSKCVSVYVFMCPNTYLWIYMMEKPKIRYGFICSHPVEVVILFILWIHLGKYSSYRSNRNHSNTWIPSPYTKQILFPLFPKRDFLTLESTKRHYQSSTFPIDCLNTTKWLTKSHSLSPT